jgi:hypothetical protein
MEQYDVQYLDPKTDEEELIEHFTRLNLSAYAFTERKAEILGISRPQSPDPSSGTFHTLADARQSLDKIIDLSLSLAISQSPQRSRPAVDPDHMARHDQLLAACDRWSLKLDTFLKSLSMAYLSGKELQGVVMLIMHMKATRIIIRSSLHYGCDRFRPFEDEFKDLLAIASWLINPTTNMPLESSIPTPISTSTPTSTTPPAAPAMPKFTGDICTIAPLYCIGMNCTDPAVHRAAIALLSIPRREGIWDSLTTAKIALGTLAVEEQGVDVHNFQGGVLEWQQLLHSIPAAAAGGDGSGGGDVVLDV